jgi:hypothetical protein
MSCEHFKQWKIDKFTSPHTLTTPSPNEPPPKENKEERPFWTTLREILIECKKEERRLIFKDFSYVKINPNNFRGHLINILNSRITEPGNGFLQMPPKKVINT